MLVNIVQKLQSMLISKAVELDILVSEHFDVTQF